MMPSLPAASLGSLRGRSIAQEPRKHLLPGGDAATAPDIGRRGAVTRGADSGFTHRRARLLLYFQETWAAFSAALIGDAPYRGHGVFDFYGRRRHTRRRCWPRRAHADGLRLFLADRLLPAVDCNFAGD